jgi:hypothetical protein
MLASLRSSTPTTEHVGTGRSEMTKIYGSLEDKGGIAKFSRRVRNGVEILEKETIRTIKLEHEAEQRSEPRLVISDGIGRSARFVSKSRLRLNELLQNIMGEPLGAK